MSKLSGTSVIKLSIFIDNLKNIAGTRFLTRIEYDNNPNKPCSYSHINKNFHFSWNELLEMADIPIKRKWKFPIKQGRKPKDTSSYEEVYCLKCCTPFVSINPRLNRICSKCKIINSQEGDF